MEMVFENRNRTELKRKFQREQKQNPRLFEESLADKRSIEELKQGGIVRLRYFVRERKLLFFLTCLFGV